MPNNWTLTEQAAIILKSYGVDDVEAARAVVALVLGEAAKSVPQGWCLPETCRTEMDVTLAAAIQHVIRALGDKT